MLNTSRGDFSTTVEYPKGDPNNPMSDTELEEKYRQLTLDVMGMERSNQLSQAVDQLDHMENVKHLTQLLAF
jgi:2-methylcitrate dehydratase PrpD